MEITIKRVSDNTSKVEYDAEIVKSLDKKDIVNRYGRCENGEIIYVISNDELICELYYDSQKRKYFEVTGDYYNRNKEI